MICVNWLWVETMNNIHTSSVVFFDKFRWSWVWWELWEFCGLENFFMWLLLLRFTLLERDLYLIFLVWRRNNPFSISRDQFLHICIISFSIEHMGLSKLDVFFELLVGPYLTNFSPYVELEEYVLFFCLFGYQILYRFGVFKAQFAFHLTFLKM